MPIGAWKFYGAPPGQPEAATVREAVQLRQQRSIARKIAGAFRALSYSVHYVRWRFRFAEFGWRSRLEAPDLLTHPEHIRIGNHVHIRKGARLEAITSTDACDVPKIEIGDGTSVHLYSHIGAVSRVQIGRDVLIAGHVYITDHDHALPEPCLSTTRNAVLIAAPTCIDDHCWLGEGCMILKGVHLGQGCVVGANAVVTKSFPPYSAVVGIPARMVSRYDPARKKWVAVGSEQMHE